MMCVYSLENIIVSPAHLLDVEQSAVWLCHPSVFQSLADRVLDTVQILELCIGLLGPDVQACFVS